MSDADAVGITEGISDSVGGFGHRPGLDQSGPHPLLDGTDPASQPDGSNLASQFDGTDPASQPDGSNLASQFDGTNPASQPDGSSLSRRFAQPDEPGLLSLPRLSCEALAGLGRDELLGVLGAVERFVNQAAGYRAQVLGALDALSRSGVAPDASPHLTLRDAAGMSERDARRMTRTAEKTREHGTVLQALCDGGINSAQAEALCDARVPDGVREELVAAAAAEDTDATRRRVRQAEADHCVETSMERFERQRKARGAGWQRDHEGMLRLWAKFDPHTGAQVEAMLEPLRRELWADDKQVRDGRRSPAQRDADVLAYALAGVTGTDTDTAAVDRLLARADRRQRQPERDGPLPTRWTTPRQGAEKQTAAQRSRRGRGTRDATSPGQNDAQLNIIPTGAARDASDATSPGQNDRCSCDPSSTTHGSDRTPSERHLPQPVLPAAAGADRADGNGCATDSGRDCGGDCRDLARRLPPAQISVLIELDALRGRTDKTGLTDAGTELPPEIVRQLACDAEIIPMILGGPGGPADIGRASRTVSRRLRRLLVARDRRCRWPGCSAPPSRCDAHHIIHWLNGGPTNLDNLVLLCHAHHQHLHKHGYRIILEADGSVTVAQEPEPAPPVGTAQPRGP